MYIPYHTPIKFDLLTTSLISIAAICNFLNFLFTHKKFTSVASTCFPSTIKVRTIPEMNPSKLFVYESLIPKNNSFL